MAALEATTTANMTQYLTFNLGDEEYGIEILRVQEIKGYTPITPIPNAPAFIKGVMNLRGTVVPVMGLRETFGMPSVEYGKFSVIIITAVGDKVIGLVVDAVSDVIDLAVTDIDMAPELGVRVDTSMLRGMGRVGDKFIILLAIDKVVSGVERPAAGLLQAAEDVGRNGAGSDTRAA
jgi:purine-binding chemotaxis protein CheW